MEKPYIYILIGRPPKLPDNEHIIRDTDEKFNFTAGLINMLTNPEHRNSFKDAILDSKKYRFFQEKWNLKYREDEFVNDIKLVKII